MPFETVLRRRTIDPAEYPAGTKFFLEVHMSTANAAVAAEARLVRDSDSTVVVNSTISTTSTLVGPRTLRIRSGELTLFSGSTEYRIEFGGDAGGDYTVNRAAVIVRVA